MNTIKNFRTVFSIFLFLALITGALAPSLAAQAATNDQGVVNVSLLNLRKGPGFNYDVMLTLEYGQKLSILGKSDDRLWLKVRLPAGKEGWVYAIYVQVGNANPIDGVNLVDQLNLRLGPGKNYKVLETLTKGEPLTVLGRSISGDWLMVRTADGVGGWVFGPFVETSSDIASLPVSEAYGGPTGSTGSSALLNIVVTIRNNKAVVVLNGYPQNSNVVAKLSNGSQKNQEVAAGSTDSSGKAQLSFEMPKNWPDGSSTLKVSTADGKFERTASIVYYK